MRESQPERAQSPDAQRAWDTAMRERSAAAEPAIAAALRQSAGSFAVLALLRQTKRYQATQANDRTKALRAVAEPELLELVGLLERPSWRAVLRLERACGRNYGLLEHWKDGPSGMTDLVCDVLGVELPAAPTIEAIEARIRRHGRRC